MQQVMRELEDQTERDQVGLRSVSVDVGRFLALLAMSAPAGAFVELGLARCSRAGRPVKYGRAQ